MIPGERLHCDEVKYDGKSKTEIFFHWPLVYRLDECLGSGVH
jgi:hypothetical protein